MLRREGRGESGFNFKPKAEKRNDHNRERNGALGKPSLFGKCECEFSSMDARKRVEIKDASRAETVKNSPANN
jgi:hypothetical protein